MAEDKNEMMLVAGALISPAQAAEAARYVGVEDIADPKLRVLWGAIIKLINDDEKNIDIPRIAKTATSRPETQQRLMIFMGDLLDGFPKMTSLVNVSQRVRRRATLRRAFNELREIGLLMKDELGSPDGDVRDLEERLARLSIAVSARSETTSNRSTYHDRIKDVGKYLDSLSVGPLASSVPTGIKKLDMRLGGGLRPGQLHTILGSTGSGKTALASQIADEAVKHGHKAVMFSMEVDDIDVYIRDVERHAGVSRWDLMPHKMTHTKEKAQEALTRAMAFLSSQPGKVVYSEPMSVEGIRQAVLTENLRDGPVKVVVVDHAQVALPSSDEKNRMPRYLEVKSTAEGLRALARNLGVAVVLTAQLNPPHKGEKPSMDQVRESKDINNCSEIVIVIEHQREEVGDEVMTTQSYLHVEKARVGFTGRVPVVYRGEVFRFEEEYGA